MLWDLGPPPRCLNLDVYVPHVSRGPSDLQEQRHRGQTEEMHRGCPVSFSEISDIFAPINKNSKSR